LHFRQYTAKDLFGDWLSLVGCRGPSHAATKCETAFHDSLSAGPGRLPRRYLGCGIGSRAPTTVVERFAVHPRESAVWSRPGAVRASRSPTSARAKPEGPMDVFSQRLYGNVERDRHHRTYLVPGGVLWRSGRPTANTEIWPGFAYPPDGAVYASGDHRCHPLCLLLDPRLLGDNLGPDRYVRHLPASRGSAGQACPSPAR